MQDPIIVSVGGASDIMDLAEPKFSQKQRIISHLKNMKADFIFIDLAAGKKTYASANGLLKW